MDSAQPRPLSTLDASFLDYERLHPCASNEIGVLIQLSGIMPPAADLRRSLLQNLQRSSDLRLLLDATGRNAARPKWIRPSIVDVTSQIKEWIAPAHSGDTGLQDAVNEILRRRLPVSSPLWECWLIHGYAPNKWALAFKAHHAFVDGIGMIQLAGLATAAVSPGPQDAIDRPWAPQGRSSRTASLLTVCRFGYRYLAGLLPLSTASRGSSALSGARRFSWTSTKLDQLQQIAHRHNVTLNDVFLACAAGALRRWTDAPWRAKNPALLWAMVPVNTRGPEHERIVGNCVTSLRIALPLRQPDAVDRLKLIADSTAAVKRSRVAHVAWAGANNLPKRLAHRCFELNFSREQVDLVISNWGKSGPLAGELGSIDNVVPLMFLPEDRPLSIALVSHQGQAHIGFAVDSNHRGEDLCELWHKAVDSYFL